MQARYQSRAPGDREPASADSGRDVAGQHKKTAMLQASSCGCECLRQSRLDAPLAARTLSRREGPVKVTTSHGVLTTIDMQRLASYTGAAHRVSSEEMLSRVCQKDTSAFVLPTPPVASRGLVLVGAK
jgi:hypothetical protein